MTTSLTYAAVTPARNEAQNLRRLADCLVEQSLPPAVWIIVDDGSTDGTAELAAQVAQEHEWVRVVTRAGTSATARGGPVVAAFHAGLAALEHEFGVVIKLDADVSAAPDYFERLVGRFAEDAVLGIASGTCYELEGEAWRPDHVTRSHVRGATRAYRWACLQDVLPLEERMGWDGVDELKAQVRGWRTTSFADLPFFHHRLIGSREGTLGKWARQGDMSHFMGYRVSYLVARTLYRSLREPRALAMLWGYASAALRRRPVADRSAREYLRDQQRLRALPLRLLEALGRR